MKDIIGKTGYVDRSHRILLLATLPMIFTTKPFWKGLKPTSLLPLFGRPRDVEIFEVDRI